VAPLEPPPPLAVAPDAPSPPVFDWKPAAYGRREVLGAMIGRAVGAGLIAAVSLFSLTACASWPGPGMPSQVAMIGSAPVPSSTRALAKQEVRAVLKAYPRSHVRVFWDPSPAPPGAEAEKMQKLMLSKGTVHEDGSITVQQSKTYPWGRNPEAKLIKVRLADTPEGRVVNVELWTAVEHHGGGWEFRSEASSPPLTELAGQTVTVDDTQTKHKTPERQFVYRVRFDR
jgi:hypothetical protein